MLFNSHVFLSIYVPIVIGTYFIIPKKYQNFFLLLTSLFFYAWGEPKAIALLIATIGLAYILGKSIEKYQSRKLLIVGICIHIGTLALFKSTVIPSLQLPIGISFFTLQAVSYLVDVYTKKVKAEKNCINFGLYLSFFPQLIAGPIIRYSTIHKQIKARKHSVENVYIGLQRFIFGLSKKVLIADQIAEVPDRLFALSTVSVPIGMAWFGAACFAIQIYCDFSGYSDMAIGLGRIFGFTIPENFNQPYRANSVKDFWRRWHISLMEWLKDYIYIPLGGSWGGFFLLVRNILIVFTLSGLWHGSGWTYISWGLFWGIVLIIEHLYAAKMLPMPHVTMTKALLMLCILLSWVVFRSPDMTYALTYIGTMFGYISVHARPEDLSRIVNKETVTLFIGFILFVYSPLLQILQKNTNRFLKDVFSILLLILCFSALAAKNYSPFIYFQF